MTGDFAALALAGVLAGLLTGPGLEKLRAPESFSSTLKALGLPSAVLRTASITLPAAEVLAGACVLLLPTQLWPIALIIALAFGFALAGALGLRAESPISCSCFGGGSEAVLGKRQLYAFPLWAGAAVSVEAIGRSWSSGEGAAYLAVVLAVLCGLRAVSLARLWRDAKADRLAASESLQPRHAPIFDVAKEAT
ncbi:MauE/DoxX family redox-associated membrane protein [Streptomyces sp. NBC_01754]|uniref:MauE/DoxX family redox-associated membrane protein n=1 Tax=Streptomyces sp. NBC_01754 TaxID=2975930 RepID=UPI003FA39313